jgi:hypothetical protein
MPPDISSSPGLAAPAHVEPLSRVQTPVDDRWRAWQARGAAHDRAFRRRLAIVGPVVALVAFVLYLMFVR